ncbi:MAG TPA: DSD1 family PLP-dependent enzyme [Verrucomicrobiales bacterium]|nr:DSD1 family PLP-dependent enzyme [Verrucomicrobiales bacterium]
MFSAAAAGAFSLWLPRPAKGYTAQEVRSRLSTRTTISDVSKQDLETPALCVDLDRLEANIAKLQAGLKESRIGSRPHAKTHKCASIARLQLEAGALGICAAKISEAEALFEEGIDRICMTTSNLSAGKIRRAMRLARRSPHFIQAVDTKNNARDLSDAAREAGVTADVVIDVAAGNRTGAPAGAESLTLAQWTDSLPHLRLRGLLAYDGGAQHVDGFVERRERALRGMEESAKTCAQMQASGLDTGIFSGGGTGTYSMLHAVPGFTDVQAGSYVFMDMQYLAIGSEDGDPVYKDFLPSLTVMTTILNNRFAGKLTTDAGAKALTLNRPRAGVIGEPGMDYDAGSDEFGVISVKESSRSYAIGDRLELIVPHCDPVVNLFDAIYGIRGEQVEVVWPITARGCSQ